jgi:hypothetical protein
MPNLKNSGKSYSTEKSTFALYDIGIKAILFAVNFGWQASVQGFASAAGSGIGF